MTTYIAKKELADEDQKTQLALGYKNIPKGAKCNFIKTINNFYGNYVLVEYDNHTYYVNSYDLEEVGK